MGTTRSESHDDGGPAGDARDADAQRRSTLLGWIAAAMGGVAMVFILAYFVAGSIAPKQHYATEVYRVEIVSTPEGPTLVDPQADKKPLTRSDFFQKDRMEIHAEVRLIRAVPLTDRRHGGWRPYNRNNAQPSTEAIARADPEFGVEVRLEGSLTPSVHSLGQPRVFTTYYWPRKPSALMNEDLGSANVRFEILPEDVVREALPLIAADVAAQSGRAELESIVMMGGRAAPPIGWWRDADHRWWISLALAGGALGSFPVGMLVLKVVAARGEKSGRCCLTGRSSIE